MAQKRHVSKLSITEQTHGNMDSIFEMDSRWRHNEAIETHVCKLPMGMKK